MRNFFYKYSDYSLFEKAFKDSQGEAVVVDVLATDESLKKDSANTENENRHVIRKDNRFSQESSFNKFFGPRKSFSKNFDMKDFSSWKNKNYRDAEKNIGENGLNESRFSFSDFMNERTKGKTFNDSDENRNNNQKSIDQLSTDDPQFKRFSLNDYMRRLEEKTRVENESRKSDDLIDTIGLSTEEVVPDSDQDENFGDLLNPLDAEDFAHDEDFGGDKFAVDKSELETITNNLEELKKQTEEINEMIDSDDSNAEFTFETFDDNEDLETKTEVVTEENGDQENNDEAQEDENNEAVSQSINQSEQAVASDEANEQNTNDLIEKNEREKQEIQEKLRNAEEEKDIAKQKYEERLEELEKSIKIKDSETKQQILQEKINSDNKLAEVKAEFKSREKEIRRLEKEAILKVKIGEQLKKELKNNLNISNLEMNNKLLEVTSLINEEKEREKLARAKKKAVRRKSTKRKIDSDIIGSIGID